MIQSKTIAMILLIAIATGGAIGTGIQTAHATTTCHPRACLDIDDIGHGQSFHDVNGDLHSHGKA